MSIDNWRKYGKGEMIVNYLSKQRGADAVQDSGVTIRAERRAAREVN